MAEEHEQLSDRSIEETCMLTQSMWFNKAWSVHGKGRQTPLKASGQSKHRLKAEVDVVRHSRISSSKCSICEDMVADRQACDHRSKFQ